MTLDADNSVTALFARDTAHQVNIGDSEPVSYSSLQDAYAAMGTGGTMKLWAISYTEDLACNRPIEATLRGGYDGSYTVISGTPLLIGTLTVSDGTVIVDGLCIQ
jgi:hypothetical protein